MLLSESSDNFNDTIHDSFGYFKAKIVDQALQTGGMQVFGLSAIDNADDCASDTGLGGCESLQCCSMSYSSANHICIDGAQWVDMGAGGFHCMQLYRNNPNTGCPGGCGVS